MATERVVDSLNGGDLQKVGRYALSTIASGDLLKTSPEGSKHKLKVKISSLLKSSGTERAYGAQLARAAIGVDWSFIKSHGNSWATILIHVLDLPDPVGWGPAIQFLSTLTTLIYGKQELIREVTNAKISDFIKRLVVMLDKAPGPALDAFAVLLQLYPGACRAYASKVRDKAVVLLHSTHWKSSCAVIGALSWLEKNAASVWRETMVDVLANLTGLIDGTGGGKFFTEKAFKPAAEEKLWFLLAVLCGSSKPVAVKLPATKLATLLDKVLRTLDVDSLEHVHKFLVDPKVYVCLESFYIRHFEMLLHHFVEAAQLSTTLALKFAKCASLLIGSTWVSPKYNSQISRLVKYVLAALDSKPWGVEGLSDYVSHPEAFVRQPAADLCDNVDELLQAIILNVSGLKNATRAEIDSYFVSTGRKGLNAAALYPGKFSILPIALNIGVEGLECLIHPRFPPLPGQSATLNKDEDAETEVPTARMIIEPIAIASKEIPVVNPVETMPKFVPEPPVPPTQAPINTLGHQANLLSSPGHDHSLGEIVSPHFEPATEPEIPIPEPSKPQPEPIKSPTPRRVDSLPQTRPEKRARLDTDTPTKNGSGGATNNDNDDDDEDDFVMPTLQMDSD